MAILIVLGICCAAPSIATAQYVQRASLRTNGGLTFTGNALGLDGATNENGQGTRGSIATFITTDLSLRDVVPPSVAAPEFPFGTTNDWQLNSSAAELRLPAGSRVVRAELVWGGSFAGNTPADNVSAFLDDGRGTRPQQRPSTAINVTIANPIPAGLQRVGADGVCASGFPCTIAALAPGAEQTTRIDLLVPFDYAGPPTFLSTATVGSDVADPAASTNAASVSTLVVPEQADLEGRLFARTQITPGDRLEYLGTVTNLGGLAHVHRAHPHSAGLCRRARSRASDAGREHGVSPPALAAGTSFPSSDAGANATAGTDAAAGTDATGADAAARAHATAWADASDADSAGSWRRSLHRRRCREWRRDGSGGRRSVDAIARVRFVVTNQGVVKRAARYRLLLTEAGAVDLAGVESTHGSLTIEPPDAGTWEMGTLEPGERAALTLDVRMRTPAAARIDATRVGVPAEASGQSAVAILDGVGGAPAGGRWVAAGNVDGLPGDEIATGTGEAETPQISVFSNTGALLVSPTDVFDRTFRGGVRVAACDIDADGRDEIIAAQGPGGARVRVLRVAAGGLVREHDLTPFEADFAGGVFVACADVDGDHRGDLIVGAGAGRAPEVQVYSFTAGSPILIAAVRSWRWATPAATAASTCCSRLMAAGPRWRGCTRCRRGRC